SDNVRTRPPCPAAAACGCSGAPLTRFSMPGYQARSQRFETARHRFLIGRWLSAGVDRPQIGEQVVDVARRQPERRHARVSHFDASDERPSEVLDRVALVEVAQRWRLCDGAGAGEVDSVAARALLLGDYPAQ